MALCKFGQNGIRIIIFDDVGGMIDCHGLSRTERSIIRGMRIFIKTDAADFPLVDPFQETLWSDEDRSKINQSGKPWFIDIPRRQQ